MAEQLRNADELQKKLAEFQDLQRQLQMVSSQKQQLIMQVEEIKMAESELAKSDKTPTAILWNLMMIKVLCPLDSLLCFIMLANVWVGRL